MGLADRVRDRVGMFLLLLSLSFGSCAINARQPEHRTASDRKEEGRFLPTDLRSLIKVIKRYHHTDWEQTSRTRSLNIYDVFTTMTIEAFIDSCKHPYLYMMTSGKSDLWTPGFKGQPTQDSLFVITWRAEKYADRIPLGSVIYTLQESRGGTIIEKGRLVSDPRKERTDSLLIEYIRPGTREKEAMVIPKADVYRPEVWAEQQEGITYIRIESFMDDSTASLVSLLAEADSAGAKGRIIDLRSNRGGFLGNVMGQLSALIQTDQKVLDIVTWDSDGSLDSLLESLYIPRSIKAKTLPTVILMDTETASAAEIFIGVLNDQGYPITTVGMPSYGKGIVMEGVCLADGRPQASAGKGKRTILRYPVGEVMFPHSPNHIQRELRYPITEYFMGAFDYVKRDTIGPDRNGIMPDERLSIAPGYIGHKDYFTAIYSLFHPIAFSQALDDTTLLDPVREISGIACPDTSTGIPKADADRMYETMLRLMRGERLFSVYRKTDPQVQRAIGILKGQIRRKR